MAKKKTPQDRTSAAQSLRCQVFNCDRHHGSYCCSDCALRSECKHPCQNGPERCGLVEQPKTRR